MAIKSRNKDKSKIILLGTGTPNAEPSRSGAAIVIIINNKIYLIDFGPGVIRRAVEAELPAKDLEIAFLTHLHSDHTAGYPDLIFTPWVLGREVPLKVFGPPGIDKMTELILEAYQEDIEERINGLEPINQLGYKVEVNEIEPGIIYHDDYVKVEAFLVNHGSWKAFGYKFYTPDKIIGISGDTAPFDDMITDYKDCDVLIHEVYSVEGLKKRSEDWQEYHADVHTSSYELAEIASIVKPKLLVLYHQLLWGVKEKDLLNEIKERYNGKVVSGKDLEVY
ncbi:MAG: MBL fold metallo-hydrolase [Candidatus Heimdallarchaeota archaeon]|nr:MBL fold metallo-hydrolase [Candidatus Heimdallarchaeota archaeon]